MSAEDRSAIIEMDVGLQSKSKSEIDDYLQKTQEIRDNLHEIRDLMEETGAIPEGEGKTKKEKKSSKKDEDDEKTELTNMLEQLDEKDINVLRSFLKNPDNFLSFGIERLFESLGPNSRVILSLVAAITAAPILYIELIKALSVKGAPFNRDWRRIIQKEIDAGLTREQSKRIELGIDQTIIPQSRGFVQNNPIATYNSLYLVNETRIARIGLDDRAAGVTVG